MLHLWKLMVTAERPNYSMASFKQQSRTRQSPLMLPLLNTIETKNLPSAISLGSLLAMVDESPSNRPTALTLEAVVEGDKANLIKDNKKTSSHGINGSKEDDDCYDHTLEQLYKLFYANAQVVGSDIARKKDQWNRECRDFAGVMETVHDDHDQKETEVFTNEMKKDHRLAQKVEMLAGDPSSFAATKIRFTSEINNIAKGLKRFLNKKMNDHDL